MYINTNTLEKTSLRQIKQAYPNISFPPSPTDEQLSPLGYANLISTTQPTGDVVTEGVPEQQPNGSWHQTWNVRDYTAQEAAEALSQAKDNKRQEINQERSQRLYPGTITSSIGVSLDLRNERDETNLMHLRIEAKDKVTAGDITDMIFRDASNTTQNLSPSEIMTMTGEALSYGKQVYAESWNIKDQIAGALTISEVEAITWPN